MKVSKELLLSAMYEKNSDKALNLFYETYGPSIRSEYRLDAENIVDLDWEAFGLLVTFVDDQMYQIRLSVNNHNRKDFDGWIGDNITVKTTPAELTQAYGFSEAYEYEQTDHKVSFEFENNQLRYINIMKL